MIMTQITPPGSRRSPWSASGAVQWRSQDFGLGGGGGGGGGGGNVSTALYDLVI